MTGFLCDQCSTTYENESVFRDHMQTTHNIAVEDLEQYRYATETLLQVKHRQQRQLADSKRPVVKDDPYEKPIPGGKECDCGRMFITLNHYFHHPHN